MVRALLAGTKTQTRRIAKAWDSDSDVIEDNGPDGSLPRAWVDERHLETACGPTRITSPYGYPGDRLWVRETWRCEAMFGREAAVRYRATLDDELTTMPLDDYGQKQAWDSVERFNRETKREWIPSIHMFRWASRLTLEVTDVRVQRLQDITPNDAEAEGIAYPEHVDVRAIARCPLVDAYAALWDAINGEGAWDRNPWVWAITFKHDDDVKVRSA
jgi:hypothetical protein